MELLKDEYIGPISVRFDADMFWVGISDGRTLGVPLFWYPRLLDATAAQREAVEFSPRGLHWDEVDEDISLDGLLAGRRDQTNKRRVSPR